MRVAAFGVLRAVVGTLPTGVDAMGRNRFVSVIVGGTTCVLLAACSSPGPTVPTSSAPEPTVTSTATVTVSPTPTSTPTASSTPFPVESSSARGCSNGETTIPAGSDTTTIGDIDGDGRADTAFYAEPANSGPEYGVRTAAGGVYTVGDGLAGPATHSGWTAGLDASPGYVTVLDDGRSADLFVFHDCRWVRTKGVDGKPYTFGLNGFSTAGTGVACNDRNGGVLLEGVLAVKRSNGRFDIRWTQIDVSADGATAKNGATETRWSDLAASDPRVAASNESHCGDAVKVHTSGQ